MALNFHCHSKNKDSPRPDQMVILHDSGRILQKMVILEYSGRKIVILQDLLREELVFCCRVFSNFLTKPVKSFQLACLFKNGAGARRPTVSGKHRNF